MGILQDLKNQVGKMFFGYKWWVRAPKAKIKKNDCELI